MEVSSELDEEVVHLTQVSGITVRVEDSEPGKRVFPEGGDDLVATFGVENVNVDVFVGGDTRHHHPPILLSADVVRRRLWREKREFRRHCSRHIAHLINLTLKQNDGGRKSLLGFCFLAASSLFFNYYYYENNNKR